MKKLIILLVFALGFVSCDNETDSIENCEITNLTATPGDCNGDNTYELTIDFDHQMQRANLLIYILETMN
ncbi:hypothetical protein ACFSO9_12440 [Mesonia maritima]|uniref:hypothetical protein n=1 Tax=Mesonia maritima TaxID=1793873 RepID=UPI0036426878